MTSQELAAIGNAMQVLTVDERPEKPVTTKRLWEAARQVRLQLARESVRRFNQELETQRRLLELARAKHEAGQAVPDHLRVELRAAAVLYAAERDRIVQRFGLRVHARS